MVSFIIEIIKRLKSQSPNFFVKLRIAMILSGILISLAELFFYYDIVSVATNLKSMLIAIFNQALVVISTTTGVSFLPTSDPTLIGNEVKQAIIKQVIDDNDEVIYNHKTEMD